ncbi:MAG: PqqD family protein [Desulfobacterales bacterium]|nr:MAG: PqqD family protein [Desulfobacterales bacterium]UCD89878.1 MAG: PqqD family protein [Desulfobacterales bacterium]
METRLDSGEVILTYPLAVRPWLAGIGRRLGVNPDTTQTKKIQLDALGTSVWEQMDGKRSVREIIQGFVRAHQLHPKEAEVAVTQFLRNLGKRGLIGIT